MLKSVLINRLLVFLIYFINDSRGLKILAVYPFQGKSHFIVGERLARGLAAKGHQVDVYSHFPLKEPIPNYNDFSLAGSMPQVHNNMSYEVINNLDSTKDIIQSFGYPVCNLLGLPIFQKLLKNPPKYDVIIVEVRIKISAHFNISKSFLIILGNSENISVICRELLCGFRSIFKYSCSWNGIKFTIRLALRRCWSYI